MGDYRRWGTFNPRTPLFDHIQPNETTRHSAGCLGDATVGGNLGLETRALSGGEVVHAAVVTVVHVVVEAAEQVV